MANIPVNERYSAFAAKIVKRRGAVKRGQGALGKAIGKSREWINLMEHARVIPQERPTCDALARALGLDAPKLWEEVVDLLTDDDTRKVWEARIDTARLTREGLTPEEAETVRAVRFLQTIDTTATPIASALTELEKASTSQIARGPRPGHRPSSKLPPATLAYVLTMASRLPLDAQRDWLDASAALAEMMWRHRARGGGDSE